MCFTCPYEIVLGTELVVRRGVLKCRYRQGNGGKRALSVAADSPTPDIPEQIPIVRAAHARDDVVDTRHRLLQGIEKRALCLICRWVDQLPTGCAPIPEIPSHKTFDGIVREKGRQCCIG